MTRWPHTWANVAHHANRDGIAEVSHWADVRDALQNVAVSTPGVNGSAWVCIETYPTRPRGMVVAAGTRDAVRQWRRDHQPAPLRRTRAIVNLANCWVRATRELGSTTAYVLPFAHYSRATGECKNTAHGMHEVTGDTCQRCRLSVYAKLAINAAS